MSHDDDTQALPMRITVSLSSGEAIDVDLYHVQEGTLSDLGYLQRVRSVPVELQTKQWFLDLKERYGRLVQPSCFKLRELINGPFDGIISPPSSRPELIQPYRDVLRTKFGARDLTNHVHSDGSVKAGDKGTTVEQIEASLSVDAIDSIETISSLLVVDDVVAEGKTLTALVRKLVASGLNRRTKISCACVLWVKAR